MPFPTRWYWCRTVPWPLVTLAAGLIWMQYARWLIYSVVCRRNYRAPGPKKRRSQPTGTLWIIKSGKQQQRIEDLIFLLGHWQANEAIHQPTALCCKWSWWSAFLSRRASFHATTSPSKNVNFAALTANYLAVWSSQRPLWKVACAWQRKSGALLTFLRTVRSPAQTWRLKSRGIQGIAYLVP